MCIKFRSTRLSNSASRPQRHRDDTETHVETPPALASHVYDGAVMAAVSRTARAMASTELAAAAPPPAPPLAPTICGGSAKRPHRFE